jgi:AraC-like DNA-binding protein
VARYQEIAPSPRLARHVECFWSVLPALEGEQHRVLPDGCTDLIFWSIDGRVQGSAVGAMTQAMITNLAPGTEVFGVRFHPGMSHGLLRVPIGLLTNRITDLDSLWGNDARELEERFGCAKSLEERADVMEAAIEIPGDETPVQRAALWVVGRHGDATAGELARHAGLSARQFRRLCIEQTGIGPKMLCRVVRFRRAVSGIPCRRADWAGFALEHGYYDQAHFINEFREFSGVTPAEYASVFSNTRKDPLP